MKALAVVMGLWLVIAGLGFAGLFSGQPALMAICFIGWTPLAFAAGFYVQKSGVSITVQPSKQVQVSPDRQQKRSVQTKRRVRQLGD